MKNTSTESSEVLERRSCAYPDCENFFFISNAKKRKYCDKHLYYQKNSKFPIRDEKWRCRRCHLEAYTTRGSSSMLCGKCKTLALDLRKKSTVKFLRKGCIAVWFEDCHAWVIQPKELALRNKQLGKDVFTLADMTEEKLSKWLISKNDIMEILYREDE